METYTTKRNQWLEVLSGDDSHSIIRQLADMTWNAAAYRIVNEARGMATEHSDGSVELNGLMHSLIDDCFFTSHMTAVRRLTDSYSLDGERGVYSLTGLLNDMRDHQSLFTREAVLSAEGLEYDYEPIKKAHDEWAQKKNLAGIRARYVPEELRWNTHAMRHSRIDRLTGTDPSARRTGDVFPSSLFNNLICKVDIAIEEIKHYVNKYIAHASAPGSRSVFPDEDLGITLNHLWIAHRELYRVANFISIYLLGSAEHRILPIPQYNHLAYIDRPLVSTSQVQQLKEVWSRFNREVDDWGQWGLKEYDQEFK